MKGDPEAWPLPPRCGVAGTPAGLGPYTQEQHAELKLLGISVAEVPAVKILVSQRRYFNLADMACPVVGKGDDGIYIITPDGGRMVIPNRPPNERTEP